MLLAQQVVGLLKDHEEFCVSSVNSQQLKQNPELVKLLMSFLVNPMFEDTELSAVCQPFAVEPFYASSYYNALLGDSNSSMELEKCFYQ